MTIRLTVILKKYTYLVIGFIKCILYNHLPKETNIVKVDRPLKDCKLIF